MITLYFEVCLAQGWIYGYVWIFVQVLHRYFGWGLYEWTVQIQSFRKVDYVELEHSPINKNALEESAGDIVPPTNTTHSQEIYY